MSARLSFPWPVVSVTVLGHFGAAFAALCMPPFYGQILQESFPGQGAGLVGWYFTLPTLAAALSNPWWGRLADRIGKRSSLLRAHLGLALSFWLTSLARTPLEFAGGLVAQGMLGGTFAASNAFLATVVPRRGLALLLSAMQGSARSALFLGPLVIGISAGHLRLLDMFAYLSALPLLAALLLALLPPPASNASPEPLPVPASHPAAPAEAVTPDAAVTTSQLYWMQGCFSVGTVLSFPYLVSDLMERLQVSPGVAGLLFGIPHGLFLLLAFWLARATRFDNARRLFLIGNALVCGGLLCQAAAVLLPLFAAGRLVMGVGMSMAYVAINTLAAATTRHTVAGHHYGRLEGANKWGAVMAGVLASLAVPAMGLAAPLWLGAVVLLLLNVQMSGRFRHE